MKIFQRKNKIQKKGIVSRTKGFTLVELMVVVAIFLIITAITLGNQSRFSSDILITNLAYQIALSIREAQVYGIGSKGVADNSTSGINNFQAGYGIHVGASDDLTLKPTSYNVFADTAANGSQYIYDAGFDQDIDLVSITQGQRIHNFCGHDPRTETWNCWDTDGRPSHFDMNIVFVKPDPSAHIWGGYGGVYSEYDEAIIVVESALGDKCRVVRVTEVGQIAVDPTDSSDTANGCNTNS